MSTTDDSSILSAVFLVGGVAVMLIVHILVVFWALRRGLGSRGGASARAADDEEHAEDSSCGAGLTAGELGAVPCYLYSKAAAEDGAAGGDCAVCLEAFEVGDRCRRLTQCEHRFHAPCVDSWLRKSRLCPVCRSDVVDRRPPRKVGATEEAAAGAQQEMVERRSTPPAAAAQLEIDRLAFVAGQPEQSLRVTGPRAVST